MTTTAISSPSRIDTLDVLRGFAVIGIVVVNAAPMLGMHGAVMGELQPVREALDLFVQQRMFPIFTLLFGVGFALMWGSAQRATRPRLVMVRRLLILGALGLLHQQLQPGEALLSYAIAGLVLLLPATFLPRTRLADGIVLALAVVGIAGALATGGGVVLIPPLMLAGWALTRLGAITALTGSVRAAALTTGVGAVIAAPMLWWQSQEPLQAGFSPSSAIAGAALATTYVGLLCLLMHTPVRRVLMAVLAPLGRTALTTYLGATLLVIAVRELPLPGGTLAQLLGLAQDDAHAWRMLLLVSAGIVLLQLLQLLGATLWLRRFRQGPLEWLWRAGIWWAWSPLRRGTTAADPSATEVRASVGSAAP